MDGDLVFLLVREVIWVVEEEWLGVVYLELFEDIVGIIIELYLFFIYLVRWLIVEVKVIDKVVDMIYSVLYFFFLIGVGVNRKKI